MARLHPSSLPSVKTHGGMYRELQIIEQLQQQLSDHYTVFHHLDWALIDAGREHHGELDVVVMNGNGDLVICEIKAGDVLERDGQYFKLYTSGEKNVSRQCQIQQRVLQSRLKEAGINQAHVAMFLVLPDYRCLMGAGLALPRSLIVDSRECHALAQRVREVLPETSLSAQGERVTAFLKNLFQIRLDLSARAKQLANTVHQLAGGLSTWIPRIRHNSGIIQVQGTAGSGKTQLAFQLLEQSTAKEHALYVCYNRALADRMIASLPPRVQAQTFHEGCVSLWRQRKGEPDFADPAFFQESERHYLEHEFQPRYDLLIVDESQDFEPEWILALAKQLKENGRMYVLGDEDQRVYSREPFDIPEAICIDSPDNYRTPRMVCAMINALGLGTRVIEALSPLEGSLPSIRLYSESGNNLFSATRAAVNEFEKAGYPLSDIVVLTFRGHHHSALCSLDQLGSWNVKSYTGSFDKDGNPIWRDGELLIDSISRYKGQSSPAVVLTELDFTELDEQTRRRLFVGMTRACMAVSMVMTAEAEQVLMKQLGA
ncbi:AAA family ATPase [Chitinilyticum piscinae]|uniref:DNA 3'-5' helicase II n=1 Tax=Chitinilyticum piscinae TaxID=2866724 RepID=A0A8J7K2R2_9NEIS|nr:AAA family ATPase [Chitinilyticum piscinae]MBE9610841.1 AAA family ATPase [Chitinilyticum piscinae]